MEYRVVDARTGRPEATIQAEDAGYAAAQFLDTLSAWEANVAYNYDRAGRPARVIIFDDIDDAHPPVFVVRRKNDKRRAKG